MASKWTADDDAALAARLAPILGEAAVYEQEWVCPNGHRWPGPIDTEQADGTGFWGCPEPECRAVIRPVYLTPVTFAAPSVLWPLWERWDTAHDWTVTIYREPGDGFEASVWQYEPGRYRTGATVAVAVARAWLGALDAEGNHA